MVSTSANQSKQTSQGISKALTPDIVVVAALLYMMSSDGSLSQEEISILQQCIGQDDQVIQRARAYIKNNKLDTFINEAIQFLDKPSKLFVLLNVYDCMYSDGIVEKGEAKLFTKMLLGFGFTEQYFKPYSELIEFKNNKPILGHFNSQDLSLDKQTPHKVMGSLLIYMMSSDGDISSQEIGQISSILGKYPGLQEYCANQTAKVKFEDYVNAVTNSLNDTQKLYIATNFCDSMMSDGSAADEELVLLNFLLNKFNITDIAFKPYFDLIRTKNTNPLLALATANQRNSNLFKNQINQDQEPGQSNVVNSTDDEKIIFNNSISDDQDGKMIKRTMDENLKRAKDDLKNAENIATIQHNTESSKPKGPLLSNEIQSSDEKFKNSAITPPNIAKIDANNDGNNIQKVSSSSSKDNIQSIDAGNESANVQQLDKSADDINIQDLESSKLTQNKQRIDLESIEDNLQSIKTERTPENIQAIANKEAIASNLLIDPRNKSSTGITIATDADLDNIKKLIPESKLDHNNQPISEKKALNSSPTLTQENIADPSKEIAGSSLEDRNIPLPIDGNDSNVVRIDFNKTIESTFAKKAQLIDSINNITNAENVNRIFKMNSDLDDLHNKLQLLEESSPEITIDDVVITKKRPSKVKNKPRPNKAVLPQKTAESNVASIAAVSQVHRQAQVKKETIIDNKVSIEATIDSQNTQALAPEPSKPTHTVGLGAINSTQSTKSDMALVLTLAKTALASAKNQNIDSREINPSTPLTEARFLDQSSISTTSTSTSLINKSNLETTLASSIGPALSMPASPSVSSAPLIARKTSIQRHVINTVKLTSVAAAFSLVTGFSGVGCDLVQCSWKQLEAPLSIEFQQYIYKTQNAFFTFFA